MTETPVSARRFDSPSDVPTSLDSSLISIHSMIASPSGTVNESISTASSTHLPRSTPACLLDRL
jgi:hypothetical protein